jgi:hypothetical protein
MTRTSKLVVGAVLVCTIHSAFSAPVRCSYGYQDATCTPAIVAAPQPQPVCSIAAGWTTTAPSQWIGSQYSAPQCNYQPPPTCASGFTQTSAPWWNGAAWVGLACSPPTLPSFDPTSACAGAIPGGYTAGTGFTYNSGYSDPTWAAQAGYPGDTAYLASGWGPGYPNACGNTHYEYALVCYVSSNSITGWYLTPSNSTTCGGTH